MTKVLAYKKSDNAIEACIPGDKDGLQKNVFSYYGRDAYIARESAKRGAWAASVVDFDNITDEEFADFVRCDMPDNCSYYHWIDKSNLTTDDSFRDSWSDIDANGNVNYDLAKAKTIINDKILKKIKENKGKIQDLSDLGYTEEDIEISTINIEQATLQAEAVKIKNLAATNITDLTPSLSLVED